VHIEDRGYQFADGVYEVCEVLKGQLVDAPRHFDRLARSLSELQMKWPMRRPILEQLAREVVRRNRIFEGYVYLQVTRGVARRDHVFPAKDTPSSVVITARYSNRNAAQKTAQQGICVITVPDERWTRVDIKTIGLLPNVLARQKAKEQGAKEAWLLDQAGCITEGAATNAWIITQAGVVVTRFAEQGILRGVTRTTLLEALADLGLKFEERAFTLAEALQAREAFITGATTLVMPVVRINQQSVGDGKSGEYTLKLREKFHNYAHKQ
jgi:D-alanine transaminase